MNEKIGMEVIAGLLRIGVEIATAIGRHDIGKRVDELLAEAGFPSWREKAEEKVGEIRRRFGA